MPNGEILQLCGIVILTAVLSTVARIVLKQRMRAIGTATAATGIRHLAPAEIAYLMRDGDMPHTLIVMTVDLVHRQVKAPDTNGAIPLRSYEKQVWVSVKDFLKQLAEQKAGHLVPVSDIKNPVKWAMRFNAIKKFVGETLRGLVSELIQDPRHIKKYFSMAGIARLALHFYTSGVRMAVERELRQELLADGFLVPEARRKKFATFVICVIPLMVAAAFTAIILTNAINPLVAASFAFLGLLNAIGLRLLFELPGFVPTYDEFAKVSADLKRTGFRLTLVRSILKAGKVVLGAILTIVSAIFLLIEIPILGFVFHLEPLTSIPLLVAFTIFGFGIVAASLDWHALTMREHATELAEAALKQTRSNVAQLRPLDTFKHLFADADYNPTFSEVVAVYGVETLWLLS